jgi:hypothetical protein
MLFWMLNAIVVSLLIGFAALAFGGRRRFGESRRVGCGAWASWLLSRSPSSLPGSRCRSRK